MVRYNGALRSKRKHHRSRCFVRGVNWKMYSSDLIDKSERSALIWQVQM